MKVHSPGVTLAALVNSTFVPVFASVEQPKCWNSTPVDGAWDCARKSSESFSNDQIPTAKELCGISSARIH
jgi:hypothetical protein